MMTTATIEGRKPSRWYSPSTWIALPIAVFYGILVIPILCFSPFDTTDAGLFFGVGVVTWLAMMAWRIIFVKRKEQCLWTAMRYCVIAFGGIGGLAVVLGYSICPGYIRTTQRFHDQMLQQANIPAIRAWANTFQPTTSNSKQSGFDNRLFAVKDQHWPECIRKLAPNYVLIDSEANRVRLTYGGGFGHWGLVVAPKGTKPTGDYFQPLEDGAWVWHELQ